MADKPSAEDDRAEKLILDDLAGMYLRKLLAKAGFGDNVYATFLVKCHTPETLGVTHPGVRTCKKWLWQEMLEVKPKVVLLLGNLPSQVVLSLPASAIAEWRGKARAVPFSDAFVACWHSLGEIYLGPKRVGEETLELLKTLRGYLDD